MEAWRDQRPIIVGCGEHSLAAETFALAGWVGGLVGEWTNAEQQVAAHNAWLRAKADGPDLVGYSQVWDERFMSVLRANVTCHVLVIETPASITPPGEVETRVAQFASTAALVRLPRAEPASVLDAVRTWST